MTRVLVIDDEPDVLQAVARRLERCGYGVETAVSAEDGIKKVFDTARPFDVIVTDMSMDDPEAGLHVLSAAFSRDLFAEVIVMTAYGNVANAVECMKRGAFDYVEKNSPGIDTFELLTLKIDQAMERRRRDMRTIELWERTAKVREREKAPSLPD
ncbi:MAG: response regulator [Fimbriimonadaceae bacterium]|nr:response regulator [Fimbriimonadaceae bacterium]